MAIKIPLTRGLFTVVDDEDSHYASSSWHAHDSRGLVYARRSRRTPGTRKVTKEYLHRLILNEPAERVDHISGDTLDNRRTNLRRATGFQNQGNTKTRKDNKTGFKGVQRMEYLTAEGPRVGWAAKCCGKGVGIYPTLDEAAVAYDCAAIVAFGEFAKLNLDPWRYISGNDLVLACEREARQQEEKALRAKLKDLQAQRRADRAAARQAAAQAEQGA